MVKIAQRVAKAEALWRKASDLEDQGKTASAMRWYRAAAKLGSTTAQYVLGNMFDERGRSSEAVYWYKRAIRGGDYTGAYNLAVHYGNLCKQRWHLHWLRIALRMGCDYAAEDTFERAIDLEEQGDLQKSLVYFESAAELGHSGAQNDLGILLETRVQPPRIEEAVYWYKRAAKGGSALAASNLALHYRDAENSKLQLRWLRTAASLGDSEAPEEITKLERQLERARRAR